MHDCFIRYEYRAAWLIHDIWMLEYMIVHKDMNIELHDYSWDMDLICMTFHKYMNIELHDYLWDMNVGIHDYLIITCFYKIRFCLIAYVFLGLGMMLWYKHV